MFGSRENVWVKATAYAGFLLWWIFAGRANCQTTEEQIERSFREGQQALQQGQFEHAAEEFKKVLALDPGLTEAEVNLGLACHSLAEYDQAVRHLEKALRERPNLVGPTVIVGMDYLKLGSPQKGIPFLERALKLDASNSGARDALATAYLSGGDFRRAAEQFKQIASLDADQSEAWFNLGHEYLELAARLAYRGAHLYRESVWGHRFLGNLLLQRGRWEDAVKEYQKALDIEPEQPGLHMSLGQAYLQGQKFGDADKEFRLELQLDSQSELAWLGLGNVQLAQGDTASALESVRRVWDISPEFLKAQRDFPSSELPADSARVSIAKLKDEPAGPAKHFLLAGLCTATNESACAEREWKLFEDDFGAWHQSSSAPAVVQTEKDSCKSHRYAKCIDGLEVRKNLTDAEKVSLGKAYFALQEYDLAADWLAAVGGVTKENAEASYWLARAYQTLGIDAYERLQESFPNSWRACQMRAEAAAIRGNSDEALKEFHAGLQASPNEPELHEAMGEFYLNQGADEQEAENELKRAIELDPARSHTLYLLGYLFVQKKENEKALPYLERALRLQPDLAEANSLLGTVYLRLEKFAAAIPPLEKAAPTDHYGNVHYQLFTAYRKLGQTEHARKELAISQDLRHNYLARDEALIMGSSKPDAEPQ